MKTFLYGVRDCHTQEPYLLRSRYGDYKPGETVVVYGYRVQIVTKAAVTPRESELLKLTGFLDPLI